MATRSHARVISRPKTKEAAGGLQHWLERETTYHTADAAEGRAIFDRQAQKVLGISGAEFLRRWDAGDYRRVADDAEGRKVRRLAMLMPFARRTRA